LAFSPPGVSEDLYTLYLLNCLRSILTQYFYSSILYKKQHVLGEKQAIGNIDFEDVEASSFSDTAFQIFFYL